MSSPVTRVAESAARWSARHPWRAVGAWLLLVCASLGLLLTVPTINAEDEDYWHGESGRAAQMVRDAGLEPPPSEAVLLTGGPGASDELAAAADRVRRSMAALDEVTAAAEPSWNSDRTAVLVQVELTDEADVAPLQEVTGEVADAHPGLEVGQVGAASIDAAIWDLVADDLRSAELTSIPVTLVLMLVAFGALVAAGIPVLLAIGSVVAAIGLAAPVSHLFPAEQTVTSMIVLVGMAVGVDYSLFFLKRQREERARGRSTAAAVDVAAATSGHSILVSGGAVVASMAGLFLVGDVTFDSLAVGAVLVVAVAVAGSITVLPAVLVLLGARVDRPRIPLLWRLNRRVGAGGISRRVLAPVVRHPRAAAVLSLALLAGLAAPALGMKVSSAGLESLPRSVDEVQTQLRIGEEFPGQALTVEVVAQGEPESVRRGLDDLAAAAVGSGLGLEEVPADAVVTAADGRTAVLTLGIGHDEDSDEAAAAVAALRDDLAPTYLAAVEAWAVGGDAGENHDWVHQLTDRMPWVIAFVLLLTLLIMGVTFRSVAVAVVSAGLNLLSVAVAFGVMTLVFQHGWGTGLLDVHAPGYLIEWLPLFVMVVLVGLSMDYHVFVLGRVREHVVAGLATRTAVYRGLAESAGTITSAAAVMVAVFSIFAVLSMMEMKMMGVGLASAILVDATVVRLVALPALLSLLGDRAWWPGLPRGGRAGEAAGATGRPGPAVGVGAG